MTKSRNIKIKNFTKNKRSLNKKNEISNSSYVQNGTNFL